MGDYSQIIEKIQKTINETGSVSFALSDNWIDLSSILPDRENGKPGVSLSVIAKDIGLNLPNFKYHVYRLRKQRPINETVNFEKKEVGEKTNNVVKNEVNNEPKKGVIDPKGNRIPTYNEIGIGDKFKIHYEPSNISVNFTVKEILDFPMVYGTYTDNLKVIHYQAKVNLETGEIKET